MAVATAVAMAGAGTTGTTGVAMTGATTTAAQASCSASTAKSTGTTAARRTCTRCGLHPSEHTTKNCPWRNQAGREGAKSGTGANASEQAMPELPACLPCDEQPCHAIDAQPVQPTVSPSRDEKLQPDDETAVSAALLERTRADAFKELAFNRKDGNDDSKCA